MILRLAVEQARSQRRYTSWTAALLTLALTLSSVALFGYATQRAADAMSAAVALEDRDQTGDVLSTFEEIPEDVVQGTPWDDGLPPKFMLVSEVDALLDSAIAAGADVAARRGTVVRTSHGGEDTMFELISVTGAFDWTLVVAEGSKPEPGQIALSADLARSLDLDLGDRVEVRADPEAFLPTTLASRSFTVSGILHTCAWESDYGTWCPEAYVAWEESNDPEGLFAKQLDVGGGSDWYSVAGGTRIAWNDEGPTPEALAAIQTFDFDPGFGIPSMAFRVGIVAGLLLIGIIIMAFAVGRAQAHARLQWVATARTLGATRRAIAAATVAETLLVSAASCLAALGLGYGVAALHFMTTRPADPYAFGPTSVAAPWWVFAIMATFAVLLGAIIAVAPAFWASRVPPVAALKPVAEATETEASRRVSLAWILVPFVASLAYLGVAANMSYRPGLGIFLAGAVAVITGIVALKEALRGLVVRFGGWLGIRPAPWAMATGDALVARPRQAVAPALLYALPVGAYAWAIGLMHFNDTDVAASSFKTGGSESRYIYLRSVWDDPSTVRWVLIVLAAFGLVALAITLAGRSTATAETATRRALGLSMSDARRASFAQHALPPTLGAVTGAVIGLILGVLAHFFTPLMWSGGHDGTFLEYLRTLIKCLTDSIFLLVLAGAVATAFGLLTMARADGATPVEATRSAGKVHTR